MTLEGRPTAAWWSQARLLPLLLVTSAGVQAVAGVVCLLLATRVRMEGPGDIPTARMDNSWTLMATATGLVLLITAAVWMAWQRGLARLLWPEGELIRQPSVQMIAWVIPVVAWWWPLQDIRRSHELLVRRDDSTFTRLTMRWWVCWLVFWAAQLAAAWIEGSVQSLNGIRAAFTATGIADLLAIPAALLASQVVREINRQVSESVRP